jgi:hypothetical protein
MKKDFTKQDFYDLLEPNGDCLEWTMGKMTNGYGFTQINGRLVKTHRLALSLEGIDINDKMVLHSCDNKICCNPAHLRAGTHQENMDDMKKRNRQNSHRGTQCHNATTDEATVKEIRKLYDSGVTQAQIRKDFRLSATVVFKIVHHKTWTHI